MKNDSTDSFFESVRKFKEEVQSLKDEVDPDLIEQTAARIERLNYAPMVIIPQGDFLILTKEKLLPEIDKILALPDQKASALAPDEPKKCEDIHLQCIAVQIYCDKKLILLRQGNHEEWDEGRFLNNDEIDVTPKLFIAPPATPLPIRLNTGCTGWPKRSAPVRISFRPGASTIWTSFANS